MTTLKIENKKIKNKKTYTVTHSNKLKLQIKSKPSNFHKKFLKNNCSSKLAISTPSVLPYYTLVMYNNHFNE